MATVSRRRSCARFGKRHDALVATPGRRGGHDRRGEFSIFVDALCPRIGGEALLEPGGGPRRAERLLRAGADAGWCRSKGIWRNASGRAGCSSAAVSWPASAGSSVHRPIPLLCSMRRRSSAVAARGSSTPSAWATRSSGFPIGAGLAAGITAAAFGAGSAATVLPIGRTIEVAGYAQAFLWFGLGQGLVIILASLFTRFRIRARCRSRRDPRCCRRRRTFPPER